jgi:MIP family channel proteins
MEAVFEKNDQRAIFAEFLGTMFFVFVGTGAVAAVGGARDSGALVAIALAHGIGILTAAAWTGNISGGHINPAVTVAMMVTKHINIKKGIAYIVAQLAGASVGSLLLKFALPNVLEGAGGTMLGSHHVAEGLAKGEALLFEIILTGFLVLVIYNTAVSKKGWGINAPIAIGLAIAAIHLVAVPFTGASVNPARSFGPFLVANSWNEGAVSGDAWIYFVGPVLGALIVAAGWLWWTNWGDSLED